MPLLINGTPVNKISGPISMHILTPKQSDLFPNLPVYMLFGDLHESEQNFCTDIDNSYDVHGLKFLGLLNKVLKPNELIDLYVEAPDLFSTFTSEPLPTKQPLDVFYNLYTECYNNKRIEYKLTSYEHETKCDEIPNIRFQSGDSRFFIYGKKYRELLTSCTIENFLRLFNSKEDLNPDTFVTKLKSLGGECIEKLVNSTIGFEDIKRVIFDQKGLIHKQLKKINPLKRDKIIDYINEYILYFETRHNEEIRRYPEIEIIHNALKGIITDLQSKLKAKLANTLKGKITKLEPLNTDSIIDIAYLQKQWPYLKYYRTTLIKKTSILPEIYTLCRSFKYLDSEGDKPILNILYFGDSHIQNILHFLTKITHLYDSTTVQYFDKNIDNYDTVSRCIEIKNDIDLNEILSNVRKPKNKVVGITRDDPAVTTSFMFRDSKISKKKSTKRSSRK
jgi:hypothetical protein